MTFIMLFLAFESVPMQNLLDRKETRQMPPNISVQRLSALGSKKIPNTHLDKVSLSSRLVSHSMTF